MKRSACLLIGLLTATGAMAAESKNPGILARVFPSYSAATNRQSEFTNREGKPALVKVVDAKPWKAGGKRYLVAFVEIVDDDSSFDSLCGNCMDSGLLAVLKEEKGKLALVARQEAGTQAKAPAEDEASGPSEAVFFSGHDQVSLDLAPYRLTRDETLIGVRIEHMWLPALRWETHLQLFRIVGGTLTPVFETPVVVREYPENDDSVVKITTTLSTRPSGRFHELVADRVTIRCPMMTTQERSIDEDCTPERKGVVRVGRQRERWSFDGKKFDLLRE
ncbi:MAG TPA: hypothetical protein VKK31_03525 [Thermoanaerobaculia bacterium]|nr:hypothetical protein [Thermoanaerobaculia bacterium]